MAKAVLNWLFKNKWLLIIVLMAALLRFYKLDQYMTFLGDEGRDALVIKGMLINHHFPLLGPPTSIGNMYLGPLYYYMMLVPMTIFWLNPVAAAGLDAIIGVLSVGLIYYLAREWFDEMSAILAAFLYAISPVTIVYSRSSWNPNPAPFFVLLSILGIYLSRKKKNYLWLILSGVGLAGAIQMHYLALIMLPVIGLLWFWEKFHLNGKYFWKGTIWALLIFLILMFPLALFDFRHNFLNTHALINFFSSKDNVSFSPIEYLLRVIQIYSYNLYSRYLGGFNPVVGGILSLVGLYPVYMAIRFKSWPLLVLTLWLLIGLLGLAEYKGEIYDHYLGFLNPVAYLLLGGVVFLIKEKLRIWVMLGLVLSLGMVNLTHNPLLNPPGNQLLRTQRIAKYVIARSNNQPFNFALIAKSNYDSAYQFYLDLYGHKPLQVPFNKTNQLFVVCEDAECQPTTNPKYEVAAFGWSKIEYMEVVSGIKIYKLVPNPH